MAIYNIKLIEHKEIAINTMLFTFEKPQNFVFKAGQYLNFIIMNPEEMDDEGNTRLFTIASPPYADHLMIATRMRNTAFKRILKKLQPGAEIMIDGPEGSFTLHDDASIPAVFLTGGIGVTPSRSILLQATKDKLTHKILLFYSNYKPEDAPFLEELMLLEKENPHYKFIGTMTEMEKSKLSWNGEKGFINKDMLVKYIDDLNKPIYYIAGPEALVTALRSTLKSAGVADDHICIEEFLGY